MLRATAQAHRRTGVPISTHTHARKRVGLDQQRVFREEGVDLSRVVIGRGAFDYWESGMDYHFGNDMYESFVNYQTRLIRVLDRMSTRYGFIEIDASKPPEIIFRELQRRIASLQIRKVNGEPARVVRKAPAVRKVSA